LDQKLNYTSTKKTYFKGDIIILQGSLLKELNFLNEGSIEIKRCGENIRGYEEKEIIERSKRIGIIGGPSIFGVENLINSSEHQNSFVAMSDCHVTKYIVSGNDYISFFKSSPPIALNILLTMKEFTIKTISNLKKYSNFIGEIDKISDNLDLIYSFVENRKTDNTYKQFTSNGGVFPPKVTKSFLTENFSTILGKTYGDPSYNPVAKFDGKKLEFYHYLLKAKPDSFIALISSQMNIFLYLYEDLSTLTNAIRGETEKFMSRIDNKLNHFFTESDSPFNKIVAVSDKLKTQESIEKDLTKYIVTLCRNLDHTNRQLNGKEHTNAFPKYDILSREGTEKKVELKKTSDGRYYKMLQDSAKSIVNFSSFPEDRKEGILKNVSDMKKINKSDPTAKESRTIIRKMQQDFIDLYCNIFGIAVKNPEEMTTPVKLFLYFGFIDEKFMNEEQLEFLINSIDFFTKKEETEFPILTLYDYLYLIYNGEEPPGLSATGEEFNKLLRKKNPFGHDDLEDSPEGRIRFELNNMIKEGMRITSDNPRAYIPYLNEDSFKGSLGNVITTQRKLDAFVKRIASVDFSIFFRETTWKIPGKSELIKKEIKPYLILVPNSGVRVQLWQEMVNNIRSSRGRFLVPVFFNGDLNKALTLALAYFRWELNKIIAGAMWMDPVEGGLVGSYYDYTQYYNKMSDLSIDGKEEIKILFNKIKIDRDRFAHDYNLWVSYEKDGLPKLNKVVRAIFFRHIPFTKDNREKLSELPLYEELNTKFKNIRNREIKSLEARFHKYAQADSTLPEDLQAYLDMLRK
jgi:hypothetical protein